MSDTEPVHSRQPDIGDKQVDRFALASYEVESVLAVRRLENP
jgi:hypothetical protein